MKRFFSLLFALMLIPVVGMAQASFSSIADLVHQSSDILTGEVVQVSDGFVAVAQGQLPYTEITIQIEKSILGDHDQLFSFRQFGLLEPRLLDNGYLYTVVSPPEWPTYSEGEQVLLFLHQGSQLSGLRAPVGLVQGKFLLRDGLAVNGAGNLWLFQNLPLEYSRFPESFQSILHARGPVPATILISFVEQALLNNWF